MSEFYRPRSEYIHHILREPFARTLIGAMIVPAIFRINARHAMLIAAVAAVAIDGQQLPDLVVINNFLQSWIHRWDCIHCCLLQFPRVVGGSSREFTPL